MADYGRKDVYVIGPDIEDGISFDGEVIMDQRASIIQDKKVSLKRLSVLQLNNPFHKRPAMKIAAPQILAAVIVNLMVLTYGLSLGFPAIAVKSLSEGEGGVHMTEDDITWFGSITLLAAPIGCILFTVLIDKLGRKKTMIINTIPYIVSWLLFYFASSPLMMFIGVTLQGVSNGVASFSSITYFGEISEPYLRGSIVGSVGVFVSFGTFVVYLLGSYLDWKTTSVISMVFPSIGVIAMFFIPESPSWLLAHGHLKEAEQALCWFRGWGIPSDVSEEFTQLVESMKRQNSDVKPTWMEVFKEFLHGTTLRAFGFHMVYFIIYHASGLTTFRAFTVLFFTNVGCEVDEFTATVIFGLVSLIGSILCDVCVHKTGKRLLSLLSTSSSAACMLAAGICACLSTTAGIDLNILPFILLIAYSLVSNAGLGQIPYMILSELYPYRVRGFANGVVTSLQNVVGAIILKTYIFMNEGLTTYGLLWFYAISLILGTIFLYATMPETEGKPLDEIQENLKNIKLCPCGSCSKDEESSP